VPLEPLDGTCPGVLTLYQLGKDAFSKDHLRILTALSPKLSAALRNAMKYAEAASAAAIDTVTGLPNSRSLFLRLDADLSRCRRSGERLAVLVANLEGLDQIRNRFGLAAGDKVLKLAAAKIREACREYDSVARIGNELVFVMPGLPASTIAQKVEGFGHIARAASIEVCGQPLLSVATGHALYPDDGADTEELLASADRRLFLASTIPPAQRVA
jgi:diguanylate cyclase (GGDEF)-like protein